MPKFKAGQSGNPGGRKAGSSRGQKLLAAIADDLPAVIAALVLSAKDGDTGAAKILLDRCLPALKPAQPVAKINGLKGKTSTQQAELIVVAMGDGRITSDQAQAMLAGIASLARIRSVDEIEQRLSALEAGNK